MRNQIYENIISKERFRILMPIPQENLVHVISLVRQNSYPYEMSISELEQGMINGDYVKAEDAGLSVLLGQLTTKQKDKMDNIWLLIGDFVTDEPFCFDPKTRSTFVSQCAEDNGKYRQTILRYLYRYWAGGMTQAALVPNYMERGGREKHKTTGKNQLGRPVLYKSDNDHLPIGDTERRQIENIIKSCYNKHTKYSMQYAYEQLLKTYYINKETGELERRRPSISQFKYHAKLFISIPKRVGEKKYARDMCGLTGSSQSEANGPGQKYQIDATLADVYLVSQWDRQKVIGRPVLYFVTDVFSRMITGFYVSLEGPSWVGAMMALNYTFMNKVDLCKKFDICISEKQWPCQGLPQQLMTDNGELISSYSTSIIRQLGISVLNASAWRPDMKGIVERSFHLLNQNTKMLLPGAVLPDFSERGGRDYRLDAKLDIYEFSKIIIHFILSSNTRMMTIHPQTSEDIVTDRIPAIPLEIWNWGIVNRSGRLRQKDKDDVYLALLPTTKATVTRNGIRFHNIYYTCETAMKENWFAHARTNKSWTIDIRYDPRNLDSIFLVHGNRCIETCKRASASSQSFMKWYLEDIECFEQAGKETEAAHRGNAHKNRLDSQKEIEAIIALAEKKGKLVDIGLASKKKKTKDIRDNRKAELEQLRKKETFEMGILPSSQDEKAIKNLKDYDEDPYSVLVTQMQEESNDK